MTFFRGAMSIQTPVTKAHISLISLSSRKNRIFFDVQDQNRLAIVILDVIETKFKVSAEVG